LNARTLHTSAATRIPPRPWWETWWCIVIALLLVAAPPLWPPVPPRFQAVFGSDAAALFPWRPAIDLLAAALTPMLGLELAIKAIVISIPVLTAAAMLWVSGQAHGRVQPSAYFALPFAYNLGLLHGFLNATLAMALALGAVAVWLRLARQPRVRAAVFVILSALICATHVLGWLCLAVMIFAAELARERAVEQDIVRRGWGECGWRAALACLPLAPPALMLLTWRAGGADDWPASLALKPGWLTMALRNRWPLFDAGCMVVIALVIYKSYRDRRFVHAPMLVAAAIGLLVLFVAMPAGADMTVAPYAIILALLSIRCNARVKLHRRGEVAWAALAFLAIRTVAGTASFVAESADVARPVGADTRDFPVADSQRGLSHPPAAR